MRRCSRSARSRRSSRRRRSSRPAPSCTRHRTRRNRSGWTSCRRTVRRTAARPQDTRRRPGGCDRPWSRRALGRQQRACCPMRSRRPWLRRGSATAHRSRPRPSSSRASGRQVRPTAPERGSGQRGTRAEQEMSKRHGRQGQRRQCTLRAQHGLLQPSARDGDGFPFGRSCRIADERHTPPGNVASRPEMDHSLLGIARGRDHFIGSGRRRVRDRDDLIGSGTMLERRE